jgi:hypothetical protein
LTDRDEALARQAAAYERAIEGVRAALVAPPAVPFRRPVPVPRSEPEPGPGPERAEVTVVDDAEVEVVPAPVRSSVPRARRVERRMLKIDDRDDADDGPWRPLDRREAALSDLLDDVGDA